LPLDPVGAWFLRVTGGQLLLFASFGYIRSGRCGYRLRLVFRVIYGSGYRG
jgi:hypothetical protein